MSYNEVLSEILNEHAPIKKRTIKVVPKAPRFDGEDDVVKQRNNSVEQNLKQTRKDTSLFVRRLLN